MLPYLIQCPQLKQNCKTPPGPRTLDPVYLLFLLCYFSEQVAGVDFLLFYQRTIYAEKIRALKHFPDFYFSVYNFFALLLTPSPASNPGKTDPLLPV